MFDLDRWREIFQSISKNKLRSALSGFTVAFAILLFTLLFGIGNGLQNTFKNEFAKDAMNSIYIWSNNTTIAYKGNQIGRRIQFKNDDFTYIKENFGDKIQTISPRIQRSENVVYKDEKDNYTIRGVYPEYYVLESAEVTEGRFLNYRDIQERGKVVVIGRMVEKDLFGQLSAFGKQINIGGIMYKVIGVFSDPGGDSDERYIYTPFSTMQRMYGNNDYVDEFGITYNPDLSIDEAIAFSSKLHRELKKRHNVSPNDQRGIGLDNYATNNKEVSGMMFGLSILILVIGFGTLIAGVVGISNIMVYIVKERTRIRNKKSSWRNTKYDCCHDNARSCFYYGNIWLFRFTTGNRDFRNCWTKFRKILYFKSKCFSTCSYWSNPNTSLCRFNCRIFTSQKSSKN